MFNEKSGWSKILILISLVFNAWMTRLFDLKIWIVQYSLHSILKISQEELLCVYCILMSYTSGKKHFNIWGHL